MTRTRVTKIKLVFMFLVLILFVWICAADYKDPRHTTISVISVTTLTSEGVDTINCLVWDQDVYLKDHFIPNRIYLIRNDTLIAELHKDSLRLLNGTRIIMVGKYRTNIYGKPVLAGGAKLGDFVK